MDKGSWDKGAHHETFGHSNQLCDLGGKEAKKLAGADKSLGKKREKRRGGGARGGGVVSLSDYPGLGNARAKERAVLKGVQKEEGRGKSRTRPHETDWAKTWGPRTGRKGIAQKLLTEKSEDKEGSIKERTEAPTRSF